MLSTRQGRVNSLTFEHAAKEAVTKTRGGWHMADDVRMDDDVLQGLKEGHSTRVDDDGGKKAEWKLLGPGLVVAATGVGAADMVATLTAGSQYGYTLLWAVIVGVIMKIVLVEGAGRFTLATGYTMFEGWRSLGKWTTWYFGPYIIIWGFVYGASAMSSTALPLATLFPSVDLKIWAILMGIAGFLMVWFNQYEMFEKIMALFVGIMFVVIVLWSVGRAPPWQAQMPTRANASVMEVRIVRNNVVRGLIVRGRCEIPLMLVRCVRRCPPPARCP